MYEQTFEQYIEQVPAQGNVTPSRWVKAKGLSIYARHSLRISGAIVLANIAADKPGDYAFTIFLNKWESKLPLLVENIHNPRLACYLAKRGWRVADDGWGNIIGVNKIYAELERQKSTMKL